MNSHKPSALLSQRTEQAVSLRFRLICSFALLIIAMMGMMPVSAQGDAALAERTSVTLMLDFSPNTNHTGFYVAQANGYYDAMNLDVEILEPADLAAEQAVSAGIVEFGIGFQEFSTFAIVDDADVVSIAAIIQENTSGFAAIAADHPLETPADIAPLTYGGFSFPSLENAMIRELLACEGIDWDAGNYLDVGFADPIELMSRERIDYAWIFYAWQGIGAEVRDIDLSTLLLSDYNDCIPNY
ncbi:MAG: ABC transporter substrate-binding protein, partial [Chloroflexota bacterium]